MTTNDRDTGLYNGDTGVVVADGPTGALLADEQLMRAHRLELPFGFDPRSVAGPPAAG